MTSGRSQNFDTWKFLGKDSGAASYLTIDLAYTIDPNDDNLNLFARIEV